MPGPYGQSTIGTEAGTAKQQAGAGPSTSRSTTSPSSFSGFAPNVAIAGPWSVLPQAQTIWRAGGVMPDQPLILQASAELFNNSMAHWSSLTASTGGIPISAPPDMGQIQAMLDQAARLAFPQT